MTPDTFTPTTPKDLIGSAGQRASVLLAHVLKIKHEARTFKLVLSGTPGTGKTTVAELVAKALATSPFEIETVNGRNVTIDVVREWQRTLAQSSLWGGWRVKLINELDLIPTAAQDLMLTFLDDLPARFAVLGTSNESLDSLTPRFRTRFQCVKIEAPSQDEICDWLQTRWHLPGPVAQLVALGACGNVRAALLDAATQLLFGTPQPDPAPAPERPSPRIRKPKPIRPWYATA